jgi:2-oxoglutarate/2-oxoacid ferredoxin oxidoreductase subunit beta
MAALGENFEGRIPAWCPGCGNFGILKAFKKAVTDLGLKPNEFTIVSGIGQSGKFPHYTRCNTFNGLHGRTLPVATGIKLVNHTMPVIAVAGDGDCYGEGGNHLTHAIRRNVALSLFVHDNQIYGLTKGQASPTTMKGFKTKVQPFGVLLEPLNPLALAVALDCSFVARGYAGDGEHLAEMMKAAITHKGFALLDILQPCVTYNTVNTYTWFKDRIYYLDASYDPTNRVDAFPKALEFGPKIPLGVIYRNERPSLGDISPVIHGEAVIDRPFDHRQFRDVLREFY